MVTVVIPTFDRPQMLRTALRSIARQTALHQIERVIVSECVAGSESKRVCEEFPSVSIEYIVRDRVIKPLEHTLLLFQEAAQRSAEFVAVQHDDDWWSPEHIRLGVAQLEQNPEALAYWAASFMVYSERSWIFQCWNVTSWIAAEYPPLDSVVKMDKKTAALSCITSGPASYPSLIGRKAALAEAFVPVVQTGNLFDHDRLFFLQLAERGPLLVNLTPQVYVRHHAARDQKVMGEDKAAQHIAAATDMVLEFCQRHGVDVKNELERRCQTCPMPESGAFWIANTMDLRVKPILLARGVLPDAVRMIVDPQPVPPPPPPREPMVKTIARWACPGGIWAMAKSWREEQQKNGNSAEPQ
ncbi:MAG: glycosyltransferase family 2 protein [Chthoniobacterales bacterium]|nr:glycosyltransferase family 2 protein [Chthoniobacterales bacterium]